MFQNFVNEYGFKLLLLVVCAVAGMLGYGCKKIYQRHVDSEEKEAVANYAALFVEQVYKELHGHEKLMEALGTARVMLAQRGIHFDDEEMKILIEAAVGNFNDAFNGAAQNTGGDQADEADETQAPIFDENPVSGHANF